MFRQYNRSICYLAVSFFIFYSWGWISSIGFGDGVVAMVHPIQAPIPSMMMRAMITGVAMSQSLIVSRVGMKRATGYEIAVVTQTMQISQPIP